MSNRYAVFIDRFSEGLDDMKRKDQKDDVKVLRQLSTMKRFSIFEATENDDIARTMDRLQRKKLIKTDNKSMGYPWTGVELTEAGHAMIAEREKGGDRPEQIRRRDRCGGVFDHPRPERG